VDGDRCPAPSVVNAPRSGALWLRIYEKGMTKMVRIFHAPDIYAGDEDEETLEFMVNEYIAELQGNGIEYEVLPPSTTTIPCGKTEYITTVTIVVVTKPREKR